MAGQVGVRVRVWCQYGSTAAALPRAEPAAVFFQELLAAGKAAATVRS